MKKLILYLTLFSVFLLSSCSLNGHLLQASSEVIPEVIPEGKFCKHVQYTLKETYSDIEVALIDRKMVWKQLDEHEDDFSCCDHLPSTEKLESDSQKMTEIVNELRKLLPPPGLTDQEKLDKIQFSIDSLEEMLLWDMSKAQRDEIKIRLDKHLELKKQYESGKITLDECYEKSQAIKRE